MSELYDLREPFKSYFENLMKFDVTVNCIGHIEIGGSMIHRPKLDPQDAQELAEKFREVLMPIMREFTEKKLEMVHAMMNGAPPVKDIMEGRLI